MRGRSNAHWLADALRNAERPTVERNRWYHKRDRVSRFAHEGTVLAGMKLYARRTSKPPTNAEIPELVAMAREARRRFRHEVAQYGSSMAASEAYELLALAREYHGTRMGPGALPAQP